MYQRKDGLWEEQIYLANGKRKSLYARSPRTNKKSPGPSGQNTSTNHYRNTAHFVLYLPN